MTQNRTLHAPAPLIAIILTGLLHVGLAQADSECTKSAAKGSSTDLAPLQVAARRGDADAMYWLGVSYMDRDYDRGVSLLQQASLKGHTRAENLHAFITNMQSAGYE